MNNDTSHTKILENIKIFSTEEQQIEHCKSIEKLEKECIDILELNKELDEIVSDQQHEIDIITNDTQLSSMSVTHGMKELIIAQKYQSKYRRIICTIVIIIILIISIIIGFVVCKND